jgi:cytochrome c-type biogenesis protein CcmE
MSFAPPAAPPLPPRRRRRWGLIAAVAVVLAVIAYFAFSSIGNALVYYLTPTELSQRVATDAQVYEQPVRLGGLVKEGSVEGPATDLTFVLTDGTTDITVHSNVAPTRSFREGADAVVEGKLQRDGTFEASQVLVKHDENYVAPSDGAVPSHVSEP